MWELIRVSNERVYHTRGLVGLVGNLPVPINVARAERLPKGFDAITGPDRCGLQYVLTRAEEGRTVRFAEIWPYTVKGGGIFFGALGPNLLVVDPNPTAGFVGFAGCNLAFVLAV